MVGSVFGATTPSITGVDIIGDSKEDRAINVFFTDRKKGFWFVPELLEFMDHGTAAEVRFDGVPKTFIKSEKGEWTVSDSTKEYPPKSRWWKFW